MQGRGATRLVRGGGHTHPVTASFVRGTETRQEQEPELAEREEGSAGLPLSRARCGLDPSTPGSGARPEAGAPRPSPRRPAAASTVPGKAPFLLDPLRPALSFGA